MRVIVTAAAIVLAAVVGGFASSSETEGLRVISLAPSTTETLFALGLDSEIVAVSESCDYPERALAKDSIGTFSQPNVERILALKPDIIFCTGLEQSPVIANLRQLGLKVCVSDPANLEELYASIIEMAALVGREREGAALVSSMRRGVESIRMKSATVPQSKRPGVFVEIWREPLMTVGKGSFVDELITLAGGINIAHDVDRPYAYFSSEQVIRRDPDYIILTYMDAASPAKNIGGRFGWENISAVRRGRVYNDVDPDIFVRPGPRLVKGLEEIYKRIHPS